MAELRGLGAINDQLRELNVTLAAVSVDPPARSRRVVEQNDLDFAILADTERTVVSDYGLLHREGGPTGDIAIPAHVLVDREGQIAWRYVAPRLFNRPSPAEVLENVRDALSKPQ